jgi:hypothetical protein
LKFLGSVPTSAHALLGVVFRVTAYFWVSIFSTMSNILGFLLVF